MLLNFIATCYVELTVLFNYIIRDTQLTLFALISDINPSIQNSLFVDNTAKDDRLTAACYINAVHYY